LKKDFNVKWPIKVIQGHYFGGSEKATIKQIIIYNNAGLNSKASEETVSESTENCRFQTPANIRRNLILPETRVGRLKLQDWTMTDQRKCTGGHCRTG